MTTKTIILIIEETNRGHSEQGSWIMAHHRFLDLLHPEIAIPAMAAPAATASGFMACPLVLQAGVSDWQQQVYQWAFEQARAVVSPSRLERWLKVSPN
jgi:hypothetical protein